MLTSLLNKFVLLILIEDGLLHIIKLATEKLGYHRNGTQKESISATHRAMPKKFQGETRPILVMSALLSRASLNRNIPVDPENLPFFPGSSFLSNAPPHVQVTQ